MTTAVQPTHPNAERTPEKAGERHLTLASVMIGRNVTLEGTITANGSICVRGAYQGTIRTDGRVLIDRHAVVRATIIAGSVDCRGRVEGHIVGKEKIIVRRSAVVTGSVTAPVLVIQEGGLVNGDLAVGTQAPPDFWEEDPRPVGPWAIEGEDSIAVPTASRRNADRRAFLRD